MTFQSELQKDYILALDTANEGLSVAVLTKDGAVQAHFQQYPLRSQAELIAPSVVSVLKQSGIEPQQLAQVAVTAGPGGFSGVRVGLSFARMFALGLSIPVQSFTTLETIASGYVFNTPENVYRILVVLTAGRGQFYIQGFSKDATPLTSELCLTKEEAILNPQFQRFLLEKNALIIIGSGADLFQDMFLNHTDVIFDSQQRVCAISLGKMSLSHQSGLDNALYLRDADAALPTKKGHKPTLV